MPANTARTADAAHEVNTHIRTYFGACNISRSWAPYASMIFFSAFSMRQQDAAQYRQRARKMSRARTFSAMVATASRDIYKNIYHGRQGADY